MNRRLSVLSSLALVVALGATLGAGPALAGSPRAGVTPVPLATPVKPPPTATARPVLAAVVATLVAAPRVTACGDIVTLSGANFRPDETVIIYLDGTSAAKATRATAAGALLPTPFAIPYRLKPGAYVMTALGSASKRAARAAITVAPLAPRIVISPTTANPGAVVVVSGQGFGRQERVVLSLDGARLVTAPSIIYTVDGRFAATFTAPLHPLAGAHAVRSVGLSSLVHASATLVALVPTPTRLPTTTPTRLPTTTPTRLPTATPTRLPTATPTRPLPTLTPRPTVTPRPSATPVIHATLAVNPPVTVRGNVVIVTGTNFFAGETVVVYINGTHVSAVARAAADGALPPTSLTIAYQLRPGAYRITALGSASKRAARTTVIVRQLTPGIALNPPSAGPGAVVTVTGQGFGRQELVILQLNGARLVTAPPTITTVNGAFSATVTVPRRLLAGTNIVRAVGLLSHVAASAALNGVLPPRPTATPVVVAALVANPTVTNRGGVVTLTGNGFAPGETVYIYINGTTTATAARATAAGLLPPTGVTVSYRLNPGTYTVTALGSRSRRAARAVIVVQQLAPALALNPSTVSPGQFVSVTGSGFGRREQVTLSLNGAALVTNPGVITTVNGAFTATFRAPSGLLQGTNTVSAIGNLSRVAAVVGLNGQLRVATQFYFAGGMNTATAQSVIDLLNPNAEPTHITLLFYADNGVTTSQSYDLPPRSRQRAPVSPQVPAGTFGLAITANRQISAQLTINRPGQDGDAILGNTGLGYRWYLAEGYTGLSFHETVSILNPNPNLPARVELQLLPLGNRPGKTIPIVVRAHTNTAVDINSQLKGSSVSIVATSDQPVVVERTLTFSNGGYGMTTRAGTNVAATNWLFAEGTTVNRFETYLTVLNPGVTPALVTASFFGSNGLPLGSKTILVSGRRRANIKLNDFLNASGVASVVTSNEPVVVERPEYFGPPNGPRIAGSDVFGRNGAGVRWSFPGGSTEGSSEFLLLYNPSAATVPVEVTFYSPGGQLVSRRVDVAPTVRYTMDVSRYLPPAFSPVHGEIVRSLSGQGFITEQTVFAPDHSTLRSTEGLAR